MVVALGLAVVVWSLATGKRSTIGPSYEFENLYLIYLTLTLSGIYILNDAKLGSFRAFC